MKTVNTGGGTSMPSANITINKNRLKLYNDTTYYLEDGQTYEIELFNPTKQKLKAEIFISGNSISGGGVVLKPGERIYLERFVESNNKFLFKTYTIDKNDNEAFEAISDNGKVTVKFYREQISRNRWEEIPKDYWTIYTGGVDINNGTGGWNLNNTHTNNPFYTNLNDTNNPYIYTMGVDMGIGDSTSTYVSTTSIHTNEEFETGRTEKGEKSDQEFVPINGDFEFFAYNIVNYEIKPLSNKPIFKEDTKRRYCHNCGSKIKDKFNFCPSCGTKQ
jgi:hypothetical protein